MQQPQHFEGAQRQGPQASIGRGAVQAQGATQVRAEAVAAGRKPLPALDAVVQLRHEAGNLQQVQLEKPQGQLGVRRQGDGLEGFYGQGVEGLVGVGLGAEAIHQLGQVEALGQGAQIAFQGRKALGHLGLGNYVKTAGLGQG